MPFPAPAAYPRTMTEESTGPSDPVGAGRRRPTFSLARSTSFIAPGARLASPVDLDEILTLHEACFPSNNGDHETIVKPAITGSVQSRMMHVHEQDGRIVAFIELERPLPHHVVVRTIAVH